MKVANIYNFIICVQLCIIIIIIIKIVIIVILTTMRRW